MTENTCLIVNCFLKLATQVIRQKREDFFRNPESRMDNRQCQTFQTFKRNSLAFSDLITTLSNNSISTIEICYATLKMTAYIIIHTLKTIILMQVTKPMSHSPIIKMIIRPSCSMIQES